MVNGSALLKPFYRLHYIVAGKESGLFALLVDAPKRFEQLAEVYCTDDKAREALEAWLSLGVQLRYLQQTAQGYALRGLAKRLARPENDATLALLQEAAGLHGPLIAETLQKLRRGKLWSLEDQDGEVIARSSRVMEAFQTEAIDRFFPSAGAVRVLEIGCGSGVYLRFAAGRNPALTAVGLELQADVAEVARGNIAKWGLESRVSIVAGDIRDRAPEESFDVVTLFNNIYYFPVEARVALLVHLMRFIRPGGFLLLITCCQGGSLPVEVLNLWGAATLTAGRLPGRDEMRAQLHQAGYGAVEAARLIPGEQFFAFRAAR